MGAYKKLCKRVKKIDPKAAEYMKKEAKQLMYFTKKSKLRSSFSWNATPQGHAYWENISVLLEEVW